MNILNTCKLIVKKKNYGTVSLKAELAYGRIEWNLG